jgi:hypothetical protein
MSLAQDHLDRLLKLDVKSYLRAPNRFALVEASSLAIWRVELACESAVCPSSIRLTAAMVITGRAPAFRSRSRHDATARLADRNGTRNGLYRLGHRAMSS